MAKLKRYSVNYIIKGRKEVDATDSADAIEKIKDMEYEQLTDYADDIEIELNEVEEQVEE